MAEIVRNPPRAMPEGVARRWANGWAMDGIVIDRGKLLPAKATS
jgi:hypothetical protein